MRINFMETRLIKEKGVNYDNMISINNPESIVEALNSLMDMDTLTVEKLVLVCLDTKNKIMSINQISQGTVNASLVSPREVFQMALLQGASSIVVAHNHPSGNVEPSSEDIGVTSRLEEAGKILGVKLLDHLIIGDGRHVSLREKGYIG